MCLFGFRCQQSASYAAVTATRAPPRPACTASRCAAASAASCGPSSSCGPPARCATGSAARRGCSRTGRRRGGPGRAAATAASAGGWSGPRCRPRRRARRVRARRRRRRRSGRSRGRRTWCGSGGRGVAGLVSRGEYGRCRPRGNTRVGSNMVAISSDDRHVLRSPRFLEPLLFGVGLRTAALGALGTPGAHT